MKPIVLVLLLFPLLYMGCGEDKLNQSTVTTSEKQHSTHRSVTEALEAAEAWFIQMDSLNATRSTIKRTVESISYLTSQLNSRATSTDTLFYLVNYENERGFALLGAPSGASDIYAISDEGHLSMSDTTYNEGLRMFMEAALKDASTNSVGGLVAPYYYGITRKGGTPLPETVSKWNQTAPYNQCTPLNSANKHGVVGCGPVATGMILANYRWPNSIDGIPIDWNAIIDSNDYYKVSQLLELIAGSKYLASYYSNIQTMATRSTPSENFKPTFEKLGYNTTYFWNYLPFYENRTSIFDFLKSGIENTLEKAPVILYGKRIGDDQKLSAHVWVADIFVERNKYIKGLEHLATEADPLIHMVWGWGGNANGYYLYLLDDKKLDSTSSDGYEMGRVYFNLSVLGRLKPNK